MFRPFRSAFVMTVLALQFGAVSAAAQPVQPQTFNLTPFLGFSFGAGEGKDSSIAVGVGFGYDLTSEFSLEAEVGHLPDVAPDDLDSAVDFSVTTFGGNILYHFRLEKEQLVPYVTAGVGFARLKASFEDTDIDDSTTEVAANFGGGAKYSLTKNASFRADLRFFKIAEDDEDFWRLYGGVTVHFGRR